MNLASVIDHTALKPDCTNDDVRQLCAEAIKYGFAAVCVPPYYARLAVDLLKDTPVKVSTVIGFPMGYSATVAKVEEIKRAMNEGVTEFDVVINIAAVKNGDWSNVKSDIDSMTRSVHMKGKTIKVILEAGLMTDKELIHLCKICADLGVNYVKTSTGFNGSGASIEHVQLLRQHLPKTIKIKAAGGIKSPEFAQELLNAGAARLGTSSGKKIVKNQ